MTINEFLGLLIPLYALLIIVFIAIIGIRRLRQKGKIPCLVLHPFKRAGFQYLKPEGNSVKPKGAKRATTFGTEDFHREQKSSWKFWRLAKEFLIFGINAERALTWKEREKNELESMWTDSEVKKYIAKMVAKARIKGKLISTAWGLIILCAIMFVAFLVFIGFSRIGAF